MHLRLLVVSAVRLGVASMEAVPLLRADVGGAVGPAVLAWVVGSAVAVAVTSSDGYGPIVVLGMMLLAQVPVRRGLRGALLGGVPLTAVSLPHPPDPVAGTGGRVALVVAVAVSVGLGLALGRFLDREGAVHERTQRTLSLVFDHSPTTSAITTTSGTLVQANAALSALTGLAVGVLPARLVVQLADVDDQRAAAERLEHEATHDALTGLPNRRALHRALDDLVAEPGARGVLVMVDLDGLEAVNDRYGHERGDDLLLVSADRLRSCLRPGDVAARLAGDELVVLVRDVAPDEALTVGRRVLAGLLGPATLGHERVEVRAGAVVRLAVRGDQLFGGRAPRASAPVRTAAAGA